MKPEERVDYVVEEWGDLLSQNAYLDSDRRELLEALTDLSNAINQDWFGQEEVLDRADELLTAFSQNSNKEITDISNIDIEQIISDLATAAEDDRSEENGGEDIQALIQGNLNRENLKIDIRESEYCWHHVSSELFSTISSIAQSESKRTLEISKLYESLEELSTELSSLNFKSAYRERLVEEVEIFLLGNSKAGVLVERLDELIGELFTSDWSEDSFENVITTFEEERDVERFIDILRGELFERKYCVPLPADRLSKAQVQIGDVEFFMQGSPDFTFIEEMIKEDERTQEEIELVTKHTEFFAVVSVVAPEKGIGETRMQRKIETAIDALNYSKEKGVVQSPWVQPETSYLEMNLDTGRWSIKTDKHHKFSIPHQFGADEEHLDTLERSFQFFGNQSENLTDLQSRFIQSYQWYGDGVQSGIDQDEFLKYAISLENLLIPEHTIDIKRKLATRINLILDVDEERYEANRRGVFRLYDTRNLLVHGSKRDIPELESRLPRIRWIATQVFGVILENYIDSYDSMSELIQELS